MSRTIVAAFGSPDDARAARQDLIGAGIPAEDLHVRGEVQGEASEERSRYWRDVLGRTDADSERHHYYAEAERRGNAALVIEDVEDREAATIESTLARHGVLDIEKLADAWRAQGWRGYDQRAPALSAQELDDERALSSRSRASSGDVRRCVYVFSVVTARPVGDGQRATGRPRTFN